MKRRIIEVFLLGFSLSAMAQIETNSISMRMEAYMNAPTLERSAFYSLESDLKTAIEKNPFDESGYLSLLDLYDHAPEGVSTERRKDRLRITYMKSIREELKVYRNEPTKERYDFIEKSLFNLISMDEKESEGYVMLSGLYQFPADTNSQTLEAVQKGLDVLKAYQQVEGREDDLSDLIQSADEMYQHMDKFERVQRSTEIMMDSENQPECVVEARKVLERYSVLASFEERRNILNEAEAILLQGLSAMRGNYKIYVQLYDVYEKKGDYANAYVMWKLAARFGGKDNHFVEGIAADMYLTAAQYIIDLEDPDNNPGGIYSLYCIWLNRDEILESIPSDIVAHLDATIAQLKETKQSSEEAAVMNDGEI